MGGGSSSGATADAHIVRGLISILLLSIRTHAREIAERIPKGLSAHRSSRAPDLTALDGLSSMVARIRSDGQAALAGVTR